MQDTFNVSLSEIVGTPQSDTWAQVFHTEIEEKKDKGKLYFLLTLKNHTDEETASLGKMLAEKFQEDYFQSEKPPFEALKEATEKLQQVAVSRELESVELAAICLKDKLMYAVTLDGAVIIIKRQEQVADLLSGVKGINTVSGFIKDDDLIMLFSSGFLEIVGYDTIYRSFDHNSPEDIASGLAPIVLGSPVNASCACLILRINTVKNEEIISGITENQTIGETGPEKTETPVLVNNQIKQKLNEVINKIHFDKLIQKIKFVNKFSGFQTTAFSHARSKKTTLSLIVMIVMLLFISSVYGRVKQEEAARIAVFNTEYDKAKTKYEEGKAIIDLNNTQARNYLSQAKTAMESQKQLFGKNSGSFKTADKLLFEINASLTEISGIYQVEPAIFYDLTLIKDKAAGFQLAMYKNTAAILDSTNSSVYLLDLISKSPSTISFGQDVKNVGLVTNGTSVYLFSKSDGIFQTKEGQKVNSVIKPDKDWGTIAGFATFGGNLYLLDKTKGEITKYMVVENGFSDPRSYLAKDVKPDFSSAKELAIDGFVWVLYDDGTVSKYGQGKPYNFVLTGLDQPFKEVTRLYTGEDTKYLYLLDKGNNRVVLFNKDTGVYQAQYQWQGMSQVNDLAVLEAEKKMYLLSGSKIYSVDLK